MQDSEEYLSWLESRRLIITQLTAMEISIDELGVRIDSYVEVSREKTLDVANRTEAGLADVRSRVAAQRILAFVWSGAIGLMAGGVAAVFVHSIMR